MRRIRHVRVTSVAVTTMVAVAAVVVGYALVTAADAQDVTARPPAAAPTATVIPQPTPQPQQQPDYGSPLEDLVSERVPVPDVSQAADVDAGIAYLRAEPALRDVLDALEADDPLDLLSRMEPLEGFCGGRAGEDCSARTNADVEGVYVAHRFEDGGSLAWSMPQTTMSRLLELALGVEDRELALAVVDERSWDGRTNYLLVFTTARFDASGLSVGSDPKHGFQLRIEPGAQYPIQAFSVLNESAEPLGWVQTYNPANQSLILPASIDGMTRIDDGLFKDSQFD